MVDKMRLIDPSHPFFKPAWRRAIVVALPFAWAGVEWHFDSHAWAYLFAGIGGFLAWTLFLTWKPQDPE